MAAFKNDIKVCNQEMTSKSGATFINGDTVTIETKDEPARVMFFAGEKLNEPIAWAGPIVMNTNDELRQAQIDLRNNTFVKHDIKMDD